MAITSIDNIASGLVAAPSFRFSKTLTAAKSVGSYQSAWLASGIPAAGATPSAYTAGSGYTCDKTTVGAIQLNNGTNLLHLAKLFATATQPCTLILADRLWACSGMGFAASTYSVTTPGSLPARITDNGLGVEAYVSNFVGSGAQTGSFTLNYLDSTNTAATAVISTVVSSPVAGQLQQLPIGALGIKQVTSLVNSATGTSGSWGITLLKPIAEIPINNANEGDILDWAQLALPSIPNDACLMLYILAGVTTATTVSGSMKIIDV